MSWDASSARRIGEAHAIEAGAKHQSQYIHTILCTAERHAKLTNSAVEKFKCRDGRDQDILWCGETRGLGVRVSSDGQTRTYFLQFRVKGARTKRYITIGRHNDPWRVDDARTKALALKAQMLAGVDPVAEEERKQEEAQGKAALDA